MWDNYAMPQQKKRPNWLTPNSDMGQPEHAPDMATEMPMHAHSSPGMDWKQALPGIAQSFQQGGLLGAGMTGLGLWLKNRKRS